MLRSELIKWTHPIAEERARYVVAGKFERSKLTKLRTRDRKQSNFNDGAAIMSDYGKEAKSHS